MAKPHKLRHYGAIPERQHDMFLLALLVALFLNFAVFAVQAIMPRLAALLRSLAPEQSEMLQEETHPFVLVDPSLFDEELDPEKEIEAEAMMNREARQTEARPDLPEEFATIPEGIDEILTAPPGNPGPAAAYEAATGEPIDQPVAEARDAPVESESAEPSETTEALEPLETVEETPPEISEPVPAETPVDFQEPREPVEPAAGPFEMPPPPPDDLPPEPAEQPPEPIETPEPAEEPTTPETDPEPAEESEPDPMADMIDLASLPLSSEGFFDPEVRRREELARREREPVPEAVDPRLFVEPPARPVEPAEPAPPVRRRSNRPPPPIKQIGGASSAPGGTPLRRNTRTSVRLLADDATMRLLMHRYGPYMQKVARQLQDSLNRQMVLNPMGIGSGQVKIRFGIAPDGAISYQETVFPDDESMATERLLSERTVREAGPFDPLTAEMAADPNFQKLTVIVNLNMF